MRKPKRGPAILAFVSIGCIVMGCGLEGWRLYGVWIGTFFLLTCVLHSLGRLFAAFARALRGE